MLTDTTAPYGEVSHWKISESRKKWKKTPSTTTMTAGTRVQCGTKRPSGKRKKNRTGEILPRKNTPANTHRNMPFSAATMSKLAAKASDPNVTSMRATNKAIRSSDLRQKMIPPTTHATTANTTSPAMTYVAKKSTER